LDLDEEARPDVVSTLPTIRDEEGGTWAWRERVRVRLRQEVREGRRRNRRREVINMGGGRRWGGGGRNGEKGAGGEGGNLLDCLENRRGAGWGFGGQSNVGLGDGKDGDGGASEILSEINCDEEVSPKLNL
jgi:hypothetical protein